VRDVSGEVNNLRALAEVCFVTDLQICVINGVQPSFSFSEGETETRKLHQIDRTVLSTFSHNLSPEKAVRKSFDPRQTHGSFSEFGRRVSEKGGKENKLVTIVINTPIQTSRGPRGTFSASLFVVETSFIICSFSCSAKLHQLVFGPFLSDGRQKTFADQCHAFTINSIPNHSWERASVSTSSCFNSRLFFVDFHKQNMFINTRFLVLGCGVTSDDVIVVHPEVMVVNQARGENSIQKSAGNKHFLRSCQVLDVGGLTSKNSRINGRRRRRTACFITAPKRPEGVPVLEGGL
jgi:hypothetical protein